MTPERQLEIARAAREAETKRADDAEARLDGNRRRRCPGNALPALALDPKAGG